MTTNMLMSQKAKIYPNPDNTVFSSYDQDIQ